MPVFIHNRPKVIKIFSIFRPLCLITRKKDSMFSIFFIQYGTKRVRTYVTISCSHDLTNFKISIWDRNVLFSAVESRDTRALCFFLYQWTNMNLKRPEGKNGLRG